MTCASTYSHHVTPLINAKGTTAWDTPVEPKRVPIPKNGVDYYKKVVLALIVRSKELPLRVSLETINRALISITRRLNPHTSTIKFSHLPFLKIQNPSFNPFARETAKIIAVDVVGIDVNASCLKSFLTAGGMGAALLKIPDLLYSILTALIEEVGKQFEIGISVKIRLLDKLKDIEALVRKLITPMRLRERAIWEYNYNIDAAMIVTAAKKNLSVFQSELEDFIYILGLTDIECLLDLTKVVDKRLGIPYVKLRARKRARVKEDRGKSKENSAIKAAAKKA
ncbi:uncharacterized protein K441DRAFT_688640 [Cenococcum geophilum 1.58]|uniref:uncharacterized protein n=1 Tax=Cenococcum geophilum 1.58 TaxID=794803 RepID=UPI00358E22B3|nr:hypothetical protein K441DRAFT_688640 [Cenococcum geophilum 1.58]